jgi:hypothetical protein
VATERPALGASEFKLSLRENQAVYERGLFPGSFPFGSFQGVYSFENFRGFFSNDVRSQIAVSSRPFCCRVRASDAVLPRRKYNHSLAALAAI